MKKPHVEIWSVVPFEWYWRLRAPNGQIIASGEGFKTKAKAKASFALVVKYAVKAVERA